MKTQAPNQPSPPPTLRADAARNRARILAEAEALFAEKGADASLEELAKRAEVGIGTLYRRFPTREDLLAAMSDARLLALAQDSRARDASHSLQQSLRLFLEELVIHAGHYRGLANSLGAVLRSDTAGCHAGQQEGDRLLQRGRQAGLIRADVSLDDLVCVVMAITLSLEQGGGGRARIRHLADLFLGGISRSDPLDQG
ncbi:TetR/AcrR family transcriptional regulator [Frateuria aurantia]